MPAQRIYLDNAATSWPKPEAVYESVSKGMRELGAPAGRGVYREANDVERLVAQTRKRIANLLQVADPSRIIFTHNGTDSINLALHGLLHSGDHVVTSNVEHNSVLRPLDFLARTLGVEFSIVDSEEDTCVQAEKIEQAIRPQTKLICLNHVSNVTGAIQPIDEVAAIAKKHDVLLMVDAAQSLGHLDLAPEAQGIDLLAAPGHKGLLGPLGTGLLYVRPSVEARLRPLRQGGTGTSSDSAVQPERLPEKYESGNLNVPGILGLGAGIQFLMEQGLSHHRDHQDKLIKQLCAGLSEISRIRLLGPKADQSRVGVVSFVVDAFDSREFATLLDSAFSIQVRSGFHCAPLIHQQLGTQSYGGAVRISPGVFSTIDEIEQTIQAIKQLCESMGTI